MNYDHVHFDVGEEKYIKIKIDLETGETVENPTFVLANNKNETIEAGNCDIDIMDNSIIFALIGIDSIGIFFLTFTYVVGECVYKKRIRIEAN